MMVTRSLTLALLVMLGPTGCFWVTTKHEGDELQRAVHVMKARLETKEAVLATRIEELQKVFEDASRLLARNSTDLGNSITELRSEIRQTAQLTTVAHATVTEV
jgi:hypothetical protein